MTKVLCYAREHACYNFVVRVAVEFLGCFAGSVGWLLLGCAAVGGCFAFCTVAACDVFYIAYLLYDVLYVADGDGLSALCLEFFEEFSYA